jgi:hypothetical protein
MVSYQENSESRSSMQIADCQNRELMYDATTLAWVQDWRTVPTIQHKAVSNRLNRFIVSSS